MPKSDAVWGIDIGQCALKALRCQPHESDPSQLQAEAFDYIEYPKILSQPEAEPEQLIRDALELFLSRNTVRGDQVAISVSGQSGLTRFIKLPPVESKKIPDIVRYEARQQIPFSLDDVVWDYQQLAGGSEEDGFALETEVGLFAMKRDQVMRALAPLDAVEIEVDYVQLAPLAIYNAILFDQMYDLPAPAEFDPENPPESVVVLSIGTDNTDLVVTNGYRVWQRSIPLGGSHFTKALSKDLKLTFAKAEHLKRNATEADDPKAVFQAMRPVFNDMLTEVQRSIGFFTNIDKAAKIERMVVMGNAMKLPGLQRFLSQNLGYEVQPLNELRGLSGGAVTMAPAFKENVLSFPVCYGLCLQGAKQASLATNLLPKHFVTERLIRDKKPWAVAATAGVLLGCAINFLGHWGAWQSAHQDRYQTVMSAANAAKASSNQLTGDYEQALETYEKLNTIGENLVSNVEGRMLWLEVLMAIDAALPKEPAVDEQQKPISQRQELHIESVDCEEFENLGRWYQGIAELYQKADRPGALNEAEGQAEPAGDELAEPPEDTGPEGPGWIVQLTGYHYFNADRNKAGATFVRETLIKQLKSGMVTLPISARGQAEPIAIRDLGISYPVIVEADRIRNIELEKPEFLQEEPEPMEDTPASATARADDFIKLQRFRFVVQFCWQPKTPTLRALEAEQRSRGLEAPGGADQGAGFARLLRRKGGQPWSN